MLRKKRVAVEIWKGDGGGRPWRPVMGGDSALVSRKEGEVVGCRDRYPTGKVQRS